MNAGWGLCIGKIRFPMGKRRAPKKWSLHRQKGELPDLVNELQQLSRLKQKENSSSSQK